jgi:formamidopyrimidine-DNA glycosylase
MHLGMTGWMWVRGADTYYHPENAAGKNEEWPPKFWKFTFETDGDPMKEVAFVDTRRLARVRLVDCPADKLRDNTPLKENGPDPVTDKHIVTAEWLKVKLRSKKVPIKALLLDQAQISGLGNWMTWVPKVPS